MSAYVHKKTLFAGLPLWERILIPQVSDFAWVKDKALVFDIDVADLEKVENINIYNVEDNDVKVIWSAVNQKALPFRSGSKNKYERKMKKRL